LLYDYLKSGDYLFSSVNLSQDMLENSLFATQESFTFTEQQVPILLEVLLQDIKN